MKRKKNRNTKFQTAQQLGALARAMIAIVLEDYVHCFKKAIIAENKKLLF